MRDDARSSDPPASAVDALVESLRGEAAADPGRFSLDPVKARETLRQRLLTSPYRYVLFLVRAAVRQGAASIDARVTPGAVELSFDGRAFARPALERRYDAPFYGESSTDAPGLRELALALTAAEG